MAKRTPSQIWADLRAAGFNPAQATIMTAVALAESAGNDTSLGDVGIENNTWGPSYGLYQVRTLKADTGRGTDRDVNWLAASDTNQARAAWDISRHGADFSPWTTYTRGTYLQFMGQAQQAAGVATPTGADSGTSGTGSGLGGVRDIAVQAVFVILGLGLLGFGIVRAAAPTVKPVVKKAAKAAEVAAVL